MMFDRRLLENFDWIFLGLVLVIAALGVLNLISASNGFITRGTPIWLKQIYWLGLGLCIMVGILFFDYHYLKESAYLLYCLGLGLLLFVLVMGRTSSGAQRWINLGFFTFQPSEMVKIFSILALAKYFSRREYPEGLGFRDLIGPGLLAGAPFLLILKQPDLGTALHLAIACLSVLAFLRVRRLVMLVLATGSAAALPLVWHFLKAYQKRRIVTFLNPEGDPLGAGYHIIQS
ncbi:MAG: FtsW/RodA/SpoVE family cell cycle protein, partial [Proteobacteria bacterium]|nr:FtsW/RodA/SpoVE family cell cycle protein [Pseudomonadota bacterium]